MGLFDFLKKREQPAQESPKILPEIREADFIDNSDPITDSVEQKNSTYSVSFATHLPVDIIYGFLRQDYDHQGYNDALTLRDVAYKEMNIAVIKNQLELRFQEVVLKYKDMILEIDSKIQTGEQNGLTNVIQGFSARKQIYESHIEEVGKMKQDLVDEQPYMTAIFKSYEVGFMRGIASLLQSN